MKKTEKIRYEIDPHNRLVYEKTGKESEVSGFRTVLDGNFEIDENNYVTYHVKKSQVSDTPQQVKLRGAWSLDKEHNLVLTLDKWGNQIAGNKLTVESELIDAKDNKLSFAVTSKDSEGNDHIYIVNFSGRWQADEHNRLSFNITKERGLNDTLTLQGAWEVNQQNEIMYTYEKSSRGKEEKIIKTITLKGYWDITEKHRIKYVLNKEIESEFDFKVSQEKFWPYKPHQKDKPKEGAAGNAKKFCVITYARILNLDELRMSLATKGPAVLGIEVFKGMLKTKTGIVPMPKKGEKSLGGHAIAACGYDDEMGLVKFKNSWSEKWGDRGYGYLPYTYIERYMMDAWSSVDIEDPNPLTLASILEYRERALV